MPKSSERPTVDFQVVKRVVSIPDVLEAFGLLDQFEHTADGGLVGCCPLAQHKHGPRPNREQWRANKVGEYWLYQCFGDCRGTELGSGDVISLARALTGLSYQHVRFWFADNFGERISSGKPKASKQSESKPAAETKAARDASGWTSHASQAWSVSDIVSADLPPLKPLRFELQLDAEHAYLKARGITVETAKRFGCGFCSRGMMKGYIAFPIFQHPPDPRPVAYIARWAGEDFEDAGVTRYKVPEGFELGRCLFRLDLALEDTEGLPIVVVEGPFDALWLAQSGHPNVVATFGAGMTDEQAKLLIETGRPIILMFDGNDAGRNGASAAAGKLVRHAFVRIVQLPAGIEPDGLLAEELNEYLR